VQKKHLLIILWNNLARNQQRCFLSFAEPFRTSFEWFVHPYFRVVYPGRAGESGGAIFERRHSVMRSNGTPAGFHGIIKRNLIPTIYHTEKMKSRLSEKWEAFFLIQKTG
jgi:hypothetical protein